MDFGTRLDSVRKVASKLQTKLAVPYPAFTLFFSVSDGAERAHVVHATGASFDAAWQKGASDVRLLMTRRRLEGRWLRVDWATGVEAMSIATLKTCLAGTKRNYFRLGLAFDPEFRTAFLEQELNANAMLYGGNTIEHAVLNEPNVMVYAARRFGRKLTIDVSDEKEVFVLSSRGLFCDEKGTIHELHGSGLDAGRRRIERLTHEDVRSLVDEGSRYLSRQVNADGSFVYGYHPCFDRRIDTYNTLRHASTTYAMIEAWEVTRDAGLKQAIDRALAHLGTLIREVALPDGREGAFLVDLGGEIKLGGNAVAVLALAKYSEVAGTVEFLPLLEKLASGILVMQDAKSGAFSHVLNFPDLSVKAAHRTIYYEGEAAFGLMRLYRLTRDPRWLAAVEKAFAHFIANDYARHHDHWLSYCVNELTLYRPEERYFRFGIENFKGYLDFVLSRITTFPTLLELMMAARQMLSRIDTLPACRHLLADVDLPKFREALEFRAHYLLNGHFWPETAMYFRVPERIAGSFFIRHHGFRVRIDDVEHYLSGLAAYLGYLDVRAEFERITAPEPSIVATPEAAAPGWTAAELAQATGGSWIVAPPEGWSATGLCIYAPAMQPGHMVAVRQGEGGRGVLPLIVRRMKSPIAGVMVTEADPLPVPGAPTLLVPEMGEAILAMGDYARSRMAGKVLAVTGSAGKTTATAMLAHALAAFGPVARSAHNANLPHGVAWNLASIPRDMPHVVLEIAIGNMARSARMARPHVALFTNILPAHLGALSTVADVARTKAAIFRVMSPGDVAVLNRDMMEWQTVHDAAQARRLKIIHYGTGAESDVRLVDYIPAEQLVVASIMGRSVQYRIGAAGTHMALNSLAVLAAVASLGLPLGPALEQMQTFSALAGRGELLEIELDGRRLTVIDDAYNANPGSMRAALERLGQEEGGRRRVAVLGQMAELGPSEKQHHAELADFIGERPIDRVHVTGDLYAEFWDRLPAKRRGSYQPSLDDLKRVLREELRDGDIVLFKGSHSTRIHQLVDWIKKAAASGEGPSAADSPAGAAPTPSLTPELSALLYDTGEDRIVFSVGDTRPHPPASITKLLTLCLVEERLNEEDVSRRTEIVISPKAARVNSWWGFNAGERVSIDVLMRACAVVSANEAANALAEWHSGSVERFTRALNERCTKLGMLGTHISSPSGLGRGQTTTARDTLVLARHIYAQHPHVASLCATSNFEWKGKVHRNTNQLLGTLPGADGLKTGTLQGHGNHLVLSALRQEKRWIAIVLGAPTKSDRDRTVAMLMDRYAPAEAD
jgi:UDP-N-acetylmuramoyl-tripeptide--D-alanyl-D-alanine ligase